MSGYNMIYIWFLIIESYDKICIGRKCYVYIKDIVMEINF